MTRSFRSDKLRLDALLDDARTLAALEKRGRVVERIGELRRELRAAKLTVVTCGEFKRGKTSLINAFLDQPGLLPTGADITTNVVCSITYGLEERVRVVVDAEDDAGDPEMVEIGRGEIADYVSEAGNPGNVRRVSLVLIELPNPRLADGLTLVDTPGVNGLDGRHTAVTRLFLPRADAVLFVGDAQSPFSTAELGLLEQARRPPETFVTVVTKTDLVEDYPTIVEKNRARVAHALGCTPAEVRIVPVSSAAKLDWLDSRDPDDLELSNFAALEQAVASILRDHRERIVIGKAAVGLAEELATLRAPVQRQWRALSAKDKLARDALREEREAHLAKNKALLGSRAQWRAHLRDEMERILVTLSQDVELRFRTVEARALQRLDDARALAEPSGIIVSAEADTDAMMDPVNRTLGYEAARVHAELRRMTGLELERDAARPGKVSRDALTRPEVEAVRSGLWDKMVSATAHAVFDASIGSGVGALLGATIGGGIGLMFGGVGAGPGAMLGAAVGKLLGGFKGLTSGAKKEIGRMRRQDHAVTREQLAPVLGRHLQLLRDGCLVGLRDAVRNLEREMDRELNERIQEQVDVTAGDLRRIEEAAKMPEARLREELDGVERTLGRIDAIWSETMEIGAAWADGEWNGRAPGDSGERRAA